MNKSINLYFYSEASTEEKLREIKDIGYEEVYTGIYDKKETLAFSEQIPLIKKLGLKMTMIHCSYYEPKLNSFWEDGEEGEEICDDYINQIAMCDGLTKNFVVHLNGSNDARQSEIGIRRIKKMLEVCEKYDINLCIENLYKADEIPYIFSRINHKNLKICYDSGHKNFLTRDFKICENYGKYITVLHLHENDGKSDEHKKLSQGSEVFERLKREIPMLPKDVVLASEIRSRGDWREYIKENFEALSLLEKELEKPLNDR